MRFPIAVLVLMMTIFVQKQAFAETLIALKTGAQFQLDTSVPGLGKAYRDSSGLIWGEVIGQMSSIQNVRNAEARCVDKGGRLPTVAELKNLARFFGRETIGGYDSRMKDDAEKQFGVSGQLIMSAGLDELIEDRGSLKETGIVFDGTSGEVKLVVPALFSPAVSVRCVAGTAPLNVESDHPARIAQFIDGKVTVQIPSINMHFNIKGQKTRPASAYKVRVYSRCSEKVCQPITKLYPIAANGEVQIPAQTLQITLAKGDTLYSANLRLTLHLVAPNGDISNALIDLFDFKSVQKTSDQWTVIETPSFQVPVNLQWGYSRKVENMLSEFNNGMNRGLAINAQVRWTQDATFVSYYSGRYNHTYAAQNDNGKSYAFSKDGSAESCFLKQQPLTLSRDGKLSVTMDSSLCVFNLSNPLLANEPFLSVKATSAAITPTGLDARPYSIWTRSFGEDNCPSGKLMYRSTWQAHLEPRPDGWIDYTCLPIRNLENHKWPRTLEIFGSM